MDSLPQIAVLTRAWRMDFGVPSPRKGPRRHQAREHLEERQHYIGGHSHMYMLDDYVAADDELQEPRMRAVRSHVAPEGLLTWCLWRF